MNIIFEYNDSNFGHNDIILNGDIKLIDNILKSDEKFNKIDNQKYLKLFRCGWKKLNEPNCNINEPTLSLSLFIPNNLNDFSNWTNKYFLNQIKLCIIFNYYFPNGNYRNYFDFYMLNKFQYLPDDDNFLNITKNSNEFLYLDYEENEGRKVKSLLDQFYNELKKYENIKFKNKLERFIFTFDLACRTYSNNNNILEFREKTGDFYIYEFNYPFVENINGNIGHITNGYIGQLIRFISLKQNSYLYYNKIINRPTIIIVRDSHATTIGYNDSQWINEFKKYNNNNFYLLGHSFNYEKQSWHGNITCKENNSIKKKSFWAGYTNFINSTSSHSFMDDLEYLNTIGQAFIINNDNNLPLLNIRKNYNYGIDEYLLSNFINNSQSKKKLLLLQYEHISNINNINLEPIISYILENNLLDINKIYSIQNIFNTIEKIRNLKINNNKLSLILSYLPTKYMTLNTNTVNINDFDTDNTYSIYNKYIDLTKYNKSYTNDILPNLHKYNIFCNRNLYFNINSPCQEIYNNNIDNNDCPPSNYFSGFYHENPPTFDISFLRQPSDIYYALESLKNNNLVIPLNKSDYKNKVEDDNFKIDILESIENINNGKIYDDLLYIISKFNVYSSVIFNKYHINYWSSLIWRTLNYKGYDVPPEWLKIKLNNNNEYDNFNKYVIRLSKIKNWTENTINILTRNKTINLDIYKMKTYFKYLKYKLKYLSLKNKK
jgi:hypothetical protein